MFTAFCSLVALVAGWYLHKYYPDLPQRLKNWRKG